MQHDEIIIRGEVFMKYINESIVFPCPTDELLFLKEKKCRLKLPHSYKEFIKK